MKKIVLFVFLVFVSTSSFSQIETNYLYGSTDSYNWIFPQDENAPIIRLDSFDPNKISIEESNNPRIFAKGFDVSISLDNGLWSFVDEGRIWSMVIKSTNASSLTLSFNDINIPNDGYMYILNEDKTILYGPVTPENIPSGDYFLTDVIPGNSIRICIYEPTSVYGRTSMNIDKVYCGYKEISSFDNKKQEGTRGCDNEIACDNIFQMESYGVAHIVYSLYSYLFYSSGFLVMTTDLSFKPYLQTAYHTINIIEDDILSDAEITAVQNGTFKFSYKYTTCEGNTLAPSYTYNGAAIRSYSSATDFALLELSNIVSNNSSLTWLGWDRSSNIPTSGVAIHHPLGNPMKISYEINPFSICDYNNSGVNNHWLLNFDNGVVKHGSSGSPILNQNKRVVGQLHGNDIYDDEISYCEQGRAQYGRFDMSWTGGGHNYDRLSNWLDPIGTNQVTINSYHPIGNIIGDNLISSYNEYYIDNFPSGYTVSWRLSDNYYNNGYNLLIQNYPTTGHCLIVRDQNHDLIDATLTAQIKYNGVTVQTLTKTGIYAYEGFRGHYTSAVGSGDINGNSTSIFYVKPNWTYYITSPNFYGATVTYDSSGATPSIWGFSPTYGDLTFVTTNTYVPVYINVDDVCGNHYQLVALVDNTPATSILVSYGEGDITVTLNEDGDPDRGLGQNQSWTVEVRSATTGQLMATQSSTSRSETISTAGWPKGIYIVKVTVGKEVLTEKVVVK